MLIEYDSDKREKTLNDRGLYFCDAPIVWSGQHFTKIDNRIDYSEERFITVGLLKI